tara:strand:+ start:80 stop:340 length:261 start_codon:yes stop_codon:yes gene_type:complete
MYQVKTKTKIMDCRKCGNEIPPKRLEIIPGTKTCVNCSTESPKRGVPVMRGTGDHTWVDLDIMTQDQYEQFEELNKKSTKLDNTID